MTTLRAVQGKFAVYPTGNTKIIDYYLLTLRMRYVDTTNADWDKNTIDKLFAIRQEQDLLLDARLEVM
jgi:hypothetical protein